MSTREEFAAELAAASHEAIAVARTWVYDEIPDSPLRYDLWAAPSESHSTAFETPTPDPMAITAEEAVATLWRDGLQPEWINVSVVDVFESSAILQLYYSRLVLPRGTGFNVRGPWMPCVEPAGKWWLWQAEHPSPGMNERRARRLSDGLLRLRQSPSVDVARDVIACLPTKEQPCAVHRVGVGPWFEVERLRADGHGQDVLQVDLALETGIYRDHAATRSIRADVFPPNLLAGTVETAPTFAQWLAAHLLRMIESQR